MAITTPTPITPSPPLPQRSDPATFENRADAYYQWQSEDLPDGIDAQSEAAYQNALEASQSATAADERATDAETAKTGAEAARDKAQDWAEGVEPEPGSKSAKGWSQEAEDAKDSAWAAAAAAGVSAGLPQPLVPGRSLIVDPSGSGVLWGISSEIRRVERTGNIIIGSESRGNLIDITSGTFTQTFDACATLGDGWFVYLKNSGTGDITLDPAGSETIDGLTSYIMYPGEARLIQCDGTVLRSLVVNAFYKVFTASGNFQKPPGYAAFEGLLWGGGGGGHANVNGSGGGGAACHKFSIDQNLLLSTEIVTIGSGGSANSPGGTSTLGPIVAHGGFGSSSGGSGGGLLGTGTASVGGSPSLPVSIGTGDNPGFGGGARASTGEFAAGKSVYGGGGGGVSGNPYFPGGDSVYGGGGGGAAGSGAGTANYPPAVGTGGQGGSSVYGGAGGAGGQTAGANGSAPGGGGGGGTTPGVGGRGELRIWGII